MRREHLQHLVCPECKKELQIERVHEEINEKVKEGGLICTNCNQEFPVTNFIPRFVPIENYANSFGYQWLKHAKTQYDSYSGGDVSERRFFEETQWNRKLQDQIMLEAGSGAGRFTEQAVKTGAMIISFDYSYAVEANYEHNGHNDNLLIVQADIYSMPFRRNYFDKIICIGVLQHTPDVEKAFMALPVVLKKGGSLVIDTYIKYTKVFDRINSKHFFRLFSKNINHESLYRFCIWYVDFMRPIAKLLYKLPKGWWISWKLLMIVNYRDQHQFRDESIHREWAICDTFDKLAPIYDKPQKVETVRSWFEKAGFNHFEVFKGFNGVTGRGIK